MQVFFRLARTTLLIFLVLGIVFFGFVIGIDYFVFRQRPVGPIVFMTEFPKAEAYITSTDASMNDEQIFSFRQWQDQSVDERTVLLRAVGDVAPVRVSDIQLRRKGMAYAFSQMEDIFLQDDLTLVNLETPLIDDCPERNEGMIFCGLPSFVGAMRDAGIDFVGLANNHSGNYGVNGIEETLRHLAEGGLSSIKDGELVIVSVKGTVFGLVAVNGVTNKGIDREMLKDVLARADAQADQVIVSVHWGAEYEVVPRAAAGVAPDDPKELGRWFVDQGADVVLGAHPHVVQGVERYNGGFIAYSHGNFIFDQEWSRETKEGVIGNYLFRDKKLVDVYFTPVTIEDWVRPRFATINESEQILKRMEESSRQVGLLGTEN